MCRSLETPGRPTVRSDRTVQHRTWRRRAATEDQTACSTGASALGRQGVILRARRKLLGVPPLPAGSSLGYRHQRLKLKRHQQ